MIGDAEGQSTLLVEQLRRCFDEYLGGTANPTALKKVISILFKIRMRCQPNNYAREKLSAIESYAGIYFSARKHQRITGGESQVLSFIWGDIDTLEDVLNQSKH